jgi:hypothetical protein
MHGRDEGIRLLGRPRCRWEDIIYLREIRWEGVEWMQQASARYQWWALVDILKNLWVPWTLLHGVPPAVP